KLARYRIWRGPDGGLWLDDGWGMVGQFSVVYASGGTRVVHAHGRYHSGLLPSIGGQAVVVIQYGLTPSADHKSLISAEVTGFVSIDSKIVALAGMVAGSVATAKAEKEAKRFVKLFARVSRAIEEDPARVLERVRQRPDVPPADLEQFRRLLALRWRRQEPAAEARPLGMQPDRGLIGSGGVRVAPAREQRPSEPGVRIGVIGPALDDGARGRLKLVKASEKLQGIPQVDVGARLVEVEPDRLPTFDRRVRVAPLGQQHAGERGVRRGSIRGEADHGAIGSLRLAISVLLGQHLSQIAVGPRVLGLDAHGIAEGCLGFRVAPLPVERHAKAAPQGRVARPQGKRFAVSRLRLEVLTLPSQAERQVRAGLHGVGPDADRRAQRHFRLGVLALPSEGDSELVVDVGVVRTQRQPPAERLRGLGVVAECPERQTAAAVQISIVGAHP